MQPVPQDLLKGYVQSQHFTSTTEIMEAMKEMFRDVIQTVMEVEMDEELGRERCERSDEPEGAPRNYRNGYTKKTVKTQLGEVDIKVPRDRNGSFEPKIIGKYDRNADGMEDKILALYACGMSQRDIAEQVKELYGVEISPELVTKISEKIMPEVTAWQNRPLEPVYPFVFMDAIHYKVREDRRYVTKAAYVVLGVTMDGRKDILGVWIGEHENSKFWLNVLNDLNREDKLIGGQMMNYEASPFQDYESITIDELKDQASSLLNLVTDEQRPLRVCMNNGKEFLLFPQDLLAPICDSDFRLILLSAMRYAMGRNTCMPAVVSDYIKRHIRFLDDKFLALAVDDIRRHLEDYAEHEPNPNLWQGLFDALEAEQRARATRQARKIRSCPPCGKSSL